MKKTLFAALPAVAMATAVILSGCDGDKSKPQKPANGFDTLPAGQSGIASSEKVNKFFDVGPVASDIKLDANIVYPRGSKFPFSFYSVGGGSPEGRGKLLPEAEKLADQNRILAGGATLVGPQYELNKEVVDLAKRGKVQAVYTINPVVDGEPMVGSKIFDKWARARKPIQWDKIKASIAEQVKAVANNPEIAYWDLTPEELRPWRKSEMEFIKIGAETIRANDPLKRPIMMYDPGHRGATSLATTCKHLDFVAKGMYTNYSGMKTQRVWNRYSVEQMTGAREILKREKDLTVLALPEMFQQPKTAEEEKMIPTWVRYDAYCSLAAGAQGIIVFSASKRKNFPAWDAYLTNWLTVCKELTGPANIGKAFLFGERRNDLVMEQTKGPKTVEIAKKRIKKTYEGVSFVNIAYDHMRYVFVINNTTEPVAGIVDGLPYSSEIKVKNLWGEDDTMTVPEGNWEYELPPYGVAGWVIYREK
ncbi:MAG: hypothetical protein E7039_06595 [Lentisphaerae bacterium]|nr:hypothetical protein [Lentisphaerota bacterium]